MLWLTIFNSLKYPDIQKHNLVLLYLLQLKYSMSIFNCTCPKKCLIWSNLNTVKLLASVPNLISTRVLLVIYIQI